MKQTKFKQMRIMLGMTQTQVAKLAGVAVPTVNTLERKGIFDTRTAKKYAAALGCNLIFLLEGIG